MNIFFRIAYIAAALAASCFTASALEPEAYAVQSALASGRWIKVRVERTGMHMIPASTLRSWGFSDPSKVRVHGYGGEMLPDVLDPSTYRDDLPAVGSEYTSRGLVFYAIGPVNQTPDSRNKLIHSVNPYSNYGYYFLTDGEPQAPLTGSSSALPSGDGCATTGLVQLVHEQELTSPGGTGRLMVGEDFNNTRTRTFRFKLDGRAEGTDVGLRTSFVAWSLSSSSQLTFSVNGSALPSIANDRIPVTTNKSGYWGVQNIPTRTFSMTGTDLELGITFANAGTVRSANLDYIEVTYERTLSGSSDFFSSSTSIAATLDADARVWDVTDPVSPRVMEPGPTGAWRNATPGTRHYAIWTPADAMPAPVRVGAVRNQNLHGAERVPDMLIIAPDVYMAAARRIADIHHNYPADAIQVDVVSLDQVLNEFGSGAFDPGAIRRFLKMHYDRGKAAGTPLRYALMIGKGTCDNRALTGMGRNMRSPMPLWVSEASLQENQSFSSDDYFALLDDYDGRRPQAENLDIAVGRIPATTAAEAATAADKIEQYLYSMPVDDWQTRAFILADDENDGVHMDQSEILAANLAAGASGRRIVLDKVYCDAYPRSNSTYPGARNDVFDNFGQGSAVFMFVGHGSPTALGSKSIIQPNDFRKQFFLRKLPFFYAATCSFLQWDSDITSMAETLMFQADGGMIGCISALRPVFITNNGDLSASFGTALGEFDADGRVPSFGEIYRRAKNGVSNDVNKMRYVLMSDPALRPVIPDGDVRLERVNGMAVSSSEPAELKARQKVTLEGTVLSSDGTPMDDFSGIVIATLYDAEFSTTSHGYGEGKEVTFEEKGAMLFTARGPVSGGRFSLSVQMPSELADNYRPATLSLFALPADKNDLRRAAGLSRDIYAFGYDDATEADTIAPVIHTMVLNGDSFTDGQKVNASPVLMATVSDNAGLNLSSSGVGHQMSVSIDGKETAFDAARGFVPDTEPFAGAFSGSLSYQLENLDEGEHTIRLRVWDMDGNYTDRSLSCLVVPGLAPEVYEVYATASIASESARFYVRHNRPDQAMDITVRVYNLLGAEVWSGTSSGRSVGGVSNPVVWNLRDKGGNRVGRGIYVYRAEVSNDGSSATTASRKIAVTNGNE